MKSIQSLKNKVIVTGASGYVGASLIKFLYEEMSEINIIACVRETSDVEHLTGDLVHIVRVDLWDTVSLKEIFMNALLVVHTAAQISYSKYKKENLHKVNTFGTRSVVNAALQARVKRFIHLSSTAVVGSLFKSGKNGKFPDETSQIKHWQKSVDYMYSKYLAELEVFRSAEEGLNATIINPGIIVGEYLKNFSGKMTQSIKKFLNFKTIYYPSGGSGFVDILDVLKVVLLLSKRNDVKGQRFIVVNKNMSYKEFLSQICKIASVEKILKPLPNFVKKLIRLADPILREYMPISSQLLFLADQHLYYNNSKLLNELEYSYIPIHKTLKKVVNNVL